MSIKYEVLKRLVKMAGLKKQWIGKSTEALLENRRRANARNTIPDLKDDAFTISRIEVMGFPVLKLIHKAKTDRAISLGLITEADPFFRSIGGYCRRALLAGWQVGRNHSDIRNQTERKQVDGKQFDLSQ